MAGGLGAWRALTGAVLQANPDGGNGRLDRSPQSPDTRRWAGRPPCDDNLLGPYAWVQGRRATSKATATSGGRLTNHYA